MDDFDPTIWCTCHTYTLASGHDTRTADGMTHTAGMCLRIRSACGDWSRVGAYACQRRIGHPGPHAQGIVRWWS